MDRDTKLIAILRRQYHITLTALGKNIFRIGIYFLPTRRQYNVVLPSQNRNLFLKFFGYMFKGYVAATCPRDVTHEPEAMNCDKNRELLLIKVKKNALRQDRKA